VLISRFWKINFIRAVLKSYAKIAKITLPTTQNTYDFLTLVLIMTIFGETFIFL